MAGTSPTRRSSRARGTQSQIQHTSSSASSSSGRPERSSRAFVKTGSPQKSTGSGSLSSEPPEDSTATTTSTDDIGPLRRRSTRGKDEDREKQPKTELLDMANISDENEIHEDDEAVRCVCGYEDYPGPPPLDEDSKNHALKDSIDLEPIFSVDVNDDLSGFFVQCDTCKVWEHGLCVGIVTEESSPDNYYCEICRRDLHKIYTASNSQKYSIYLPIHRPSRSTSRAASTATHGTRSPKGSDRKLSRASAAAAAAAAAQSSAKRRSTMNSRDAAYDEEEQLRRAIEASKEDTITEEPEPPSRRPKRGRDDEEEHPESIIKRQRTNSKSPTPLADQAPLASREDSDDEATMQNGLSRKSSSRNTARTQRERTERDERREEQERKRAEAASKRKGRAERRRAEDSDPSEEMPLVTRTVVSRATESVQPPDPPASSQPTPDTPPAHVPQPSTQNKKKPVPQPKKKGRNQYTKDRDAHEHDTSPARSMSRDISRNQDDNSKSTPNEGSNKHHNSKTKGTMGSKVAMSDLKRRANNILEYITRTQVELANEPLSEKNSPQRTATDDVLAGPLPSIQHSDQEKSNGVPDEKMAAKSAAPSTLSVPADFKDLSCVEMMDFLTRDLVKWQHEYAS